MVGRAWLGVGLERIPGFQKRGSSLRTDPSIPRNWKGFEVSRRYGDTLYKIVVKNSKGVCSGASRVGLDGTAPDAGAQVPLSDDRREHPVEVRLGQPTKICLFEPETAV